MYCELKMTYLLSSTGIRTEQDFYVRLIDSMTKQVGRYLKIPRFTGESLCVICSESERVHVCRAPWWVWGYTL